MKNENATSSGMTAVSQGLSRAEGSDKKHFTMPELMRLTRMTRKQATYWAQEGLLKPTMRETDAPVGKAASFYSEEDVVKALIICDIKQRGFSLGQVRKVVENLEKKGIRFKECAPYLLTDGYSVYYAKNSNEVVDIMKHSNQLMLVEVHEKVEWLKEVA